jgi:hypothetical protein
MATGNQDMGFRKNYKITGKPGYAGGPGSPIVAVLKNKLGRKYTHLCVLSYKEGF